MKKFYWLNLLLPLLISCGISKGTASSASSTTSSSSSLYAPLTSFAFNQSTFTIAVGDSSTDLYPIFNQGSSERVNKSYTISGDSIDGKQYVKYVSSTHTLMAYRTGECDLVLTSNDSSALTASCHIKITLPPTKEVTFDEVYSNQVSGQFISLKGAILEGLYNIVDGQYVKACLSDTTSFHQILLVSSSGLLHFKKTPNDFMVTYEEFFDQGSTLSDFHNGEAVDFLGYRYSSGSTSLLMGQITNHRSVTLPTTTAKLAIVDNAGGQGTGISLSKTSEITYGETLTVTSPKKPDHFVVKHGLFYDSNVSSSNDGSNFIYSFSSTFINEITITFNKKPSSTLVSTYTFNLVGSSDITSTFLTSSLRFEGQSVIDSVTVNSGVTKSGSSELLLHNASLSLNLVSDKADYAKFHFKRYSSKVDGKVHVNTELFDTSINTSYEWYSDTVKNSSTVSIFNSDHDWVYFDSITFYKNVT